MRKTLMVVSLLVSFGSVNAAGLSGVSGFDGKGVSGNDGPLALAFSPVVTSSGVYTVTVNHVVAIFTEDPGLPGTSKVVSPDTGKPNWILKTLPQGATLYAIGLGTDWAGPDSNINNLDLSKAKARGAIQSNTAQLDFIRPAEQKCRVVNWVVEFPDGKRAWGPNGNDNYPFHVKLSGNPATAWCFKGTGVVAMDGAMRKELATKQ